MTWPLSVPKAGPEQRLLSTTPTPLPGNCLMVTDAHADISQHPSPTSCYVLVPDLATHVKQHPRTRTATVHPFSLYNYFGAC